MWIKMFKHCLIRFAYLLCRGHQTFLFVGLECLRSKCPRNIWILYRCYIIFISYINQIPEKNGSRYQNLVLSYIVSARTTGFSQQNKVFDEAASPQPVETPSKTCKNSSKPIKTRKKRSPKPTKSLVCRGHQTLFFVGLECLSICPQNFWILYRS